MSFERMRKPHPENVQQKSNKHIFKPSYKTLINKKDQAGIQAKLKVGASNDTHEKEADKVANHIANRSSQSEGSKRVASMENVQPQNGNAIQREITQAGNPSSHVSPEGSTSVESKLSATKGKGAPMDEATRSEMESGFGTDFSAVRIHTGSEASEMNEELGAKAFTTGRDVYFNEGQFNPGSKEGKHLLAHELTHTVQQGRGKMIQRSIEPEQVSQEMIGKGFFLDQAVTVTFDSGNVIFPKWQYLKILEWDNAQTRVRVSALHKEKNKKYSFNVRKDLITPYADKGPELNKYESGLDSVKDKIETGQNKIDKWKAGKSEYEKFGTMNIYNDQLENLENLQATRYVDLNRKLIQESMFNDFDVLIKKWTDYYNKEIGAKKGWSDLDANLVKSVIFQESQMGTSGTHLLESPRYEGDPKSRYNLMQSIDSSGAILTLMMNEMDPELANRHKINNVTKELNEDKKLLDDLDKLKKNKSLTSLEQVDFDRILKRITFPPNTKRYWDNYYWSDSRFYSAWKEFNAKPTGKDRNVDYDFWIQTGIRWLFKKREKVSNWSEAIKAFNGDGSDASYYRDNVVTRRDKAKTAATSGAEFIPKLEY